MSCGIGMYGLQFLEHSHSHGKLSLESETLKIAELFTLLGAKSPCPLGHGHLLILSTIYNSFHP